MKPMFFLGKKGKISAILVAMLVLSLTNVIQLTASAETNDQIYLKDGSIMKGTILELTQTTCRIQTAYGVMTINRADILRIESGALRSEPQPSEGLSKDMSQPFDSLKGRPEEQGQPIKESPKWGFGIFLDGNTRTLTIDNGEVSHFGGGLMFHVDYLMVRFTFGPYTNGVSYRYKSSGNSFDYTGGVGVQSGVEIHTSYRPATASSLVEYTLNIRGNISSSPMDTVEISGTRVSTVDTDILYVTEHLWVGGMVRRRLGAVTGYGGGYLSAFKGYGSANSDLGGYREGQIIDDLTGAAFSVGVLGGLELNLSEHSAGIAELAFGNRDSVHLRIGFAGKF